MTEPQVRPGIDVDGLAAWMDEAALPGKSEPLQARFLSGGTQNVIYELTRGDERMPAEEEMEGVVVHRVREPRRPRDLGEFVTWIEHMNSDMLAAGVELAERYDFDLVHGHDWLVASACDHLARLLRCPLVMTIHATEFGRHQGWVDKHPQTYIHGVERWITNRSDRVIACSHYMREQIADIFGVDEERVSVIPNGIDPDDLPAQEPAELAKLRAEFAAPEEKLVLLIGRLVYEKMLARPDAMYGQKIGSNYQAQGLKLSKHFKV